MVKTNAVLEGRTERNAVFGFMVEQVVRRVIHGAAARVAYLRPAPPGRDTGYWTEAARTLVSAAKKLGFELRVFNVARPEDFDPAFKAIQAWRAHALYSQGTPLTFPELQRIADFANASRMPSFFDSRSFAEVGGLFSYGPEILQLFVQSVGHIDRILRGANPATLPVEMPTRYELFVNRKTAKALGITIPQSLLLRAEQCIYCANDALLAIRRALKLCRGKTLSPT